ncbi:MAG: helix-turn-helix domain-containing protein [Clostridia bacterium]|nr:helix-turn-helix domain-containing protein [Clostridia bacterium]
MNETIFYGTKEVAKCLGCSIPTARDIMYRQDFPLIKVGKNLRVLKSAFEQWASQRRE